MLYSMFLAQIVLGAALLPPLPNWIDPSRETLKPVSIPSDFSPPPVNFRVPAEYEPTSTVVLGWSGFSSLLTGITQATIRFGNASVWAVKGPTQIQGISAQKYKSIGLNIDTVWMRDYGPFGIDASGQVGIVDTVYRHFQYRTNDDKLPAALAKVNNYPSYQLPVILDGGNFMVDSVGNLFMTKRTYLWNKEKSEAQVNQLLKDYFNVKNIYAIDYAGFPGEPTDGTGHIDMFVKLLTDDTVLISTSDTEPQKSTSERAIQFFTFLKAPNGKPYKILQVKGWTRSRTWYTYTNSLIVNNVVIVPSYSGRASDEVVVKKLYEQGMPGINVQFVPSDESIVQGGSIHCVTQSIPVVN